MEITYYVYGLGYDKDNCITDYEEYFGESDTYEGAYKLFSNLQSRNVESFFVNAPEVYQLLIHIEVCEGNDTWVECIDVKNEWWIINPNYV